MDTSWWKKSAGGGSRGGGASKAVEETVYAVHLRLKSSPATATHNYTSLSVPRDALFDWSVPYRQDIMGMYPLCLVGCQQLAGAAQRHGGR